MPQTPTTQFDLYVHVRVLIGIILGLSVTRLVGGVAGFIQHPGRDRISLIHLGWVAWALLSVITFWWWEFRLSLIPRWNFGLYFFIVIYSSMFFFLSALLFPEDLSEYHGYQDYFLSRRVWFFGFVALTLALDLVDTWIKGTEYWRTLGPEYPVRIIALLALCAIAAFGIEHLAEVSAAYTAWKQDGGDPVPVLVVVIRDDYYDKKLIDTERLDIL
jgi:hypothetical protein